MACHRPTKEMYYYYNHKLVKILFTSYLRYVIGLWQDGQTGPGKICLDRTGTNLVSIVTIVAISHWAAYDVTNGSIVTHASCWLPDFYYIKVSLYIYNVTNKCYVSLWDWDAIGLPDLTCLIPVMLQACKNSCTGLTFLFMTETGLSCFVLIL